MNPHAQLILDAVNEAQRDFKSKDDAEKFLIQSVAALAVVVLGPWYQRGVMPHPSEFNNQIAAITMGGVDGMLEAAKGIGHERN